MLKFFSGMLTGILIIVITVVCCVFAVPVGSYTNMVGVELEEGSEIKDQSVMEAVKTAINTVSNINNNSINDIRKTFGIDIIGILLKGKDNVERSIFDDVANAQFKDIGPAVTRMKIQDVLSFANIEIKDPNIKDIITPILGDSISKFIGDDTVEGSKGSQEMIQKIMDALTIENINGLVPNALPNIPLFSEPTTTLKSIMEKITKNELTLGELLEIKSGDLLEPLKDSTLFPNKSVPAEKDTTYIANKLLKTPINELFPKLQGDVIKNVGKYSIDELTKDDTLKNITIGDLLGIDKEDPNTNDILKALADKTIEQLGKKETINSITLGKLLGVTEESNAIIKALADKTIGDLTNADALTDTFKTLKISDVMTIEEGSFLLKLKDSEGNSFNTWTISSISGNMDSAIKGLKVSDVLDTTDETTLPGNLFYMNGTKKVMFKDWKVSEMSGKLNEAVKTIDVFSIIPNSDTGLLGALKSQATPEDPITLTNIGEKTSNMVGTATLQNLKDWGVLGEDVEQTTLNKNISVITGKKDQTLGDCTIADLINLIPGVIDMINKIPSIPGGGSKVA